MINQKASRKEKAVVKKVYATRQKTIISESASFTDISQKDKSKIEGTYQCFIQDLLLGEKQCGALILVLY